MMPFDGPVSMDPLLMIMLLLPEIEIALAAMPSVRIAPLLVIVLDPPVARMPSALFLVVWTIPLFVI